MNQANILQAMLGLQLGCGQGNILLVDFELFIIKIELAMLDNALPINNGDRRTFTTIDRLVISLPGLKGADRFYFFR
ncbi:hypothetical protein KSZ_41700 [Dictyobacter formicarum]|uniref:Uncharacterized protein n=1 Tax=Dictyobacter formicarum TaxID=2778368 RepID=A0ABQ3VKE8_9CHLR|nr:hypothetical protein KSZ_41700 [Dictyobacter formicarum]